MSAPTTIPAINAAQFAARIAANFPKRWASPDAAQSGNLYALLLAAGTPLAAVLTEIQYALNATNVKTETSPELDLASQDLLGSTLPRPPGMSDQAFASLILSNLFKSAATRSVLSNALLQLTGIAPRMLEPWAPGDTGALDGPSFFDIDTRANPFRVSGEERFTGFIETAATTGGMPLGPNPVATLDDGLWLDVAGSFVGDIQVAGASNVYSVINKLRAFGVTIGVKIVAAPK